MISQVYSNYIAEYGMRPYSKHSTHKKSELKSVYNSIVKLNKSSPFYKLDVSDNAQTRAIDIKENARSLAEITEDLTDVQTGGMTFKSLANSDNEAVASAEYIGDNTTAGTTHSFNISVDQLAEPQINTGAFLNNHSNVLSSGTYVFDVNISSITYELQFSVKDTENTLDIQNKLSRLINKSQIGLSAAVIDNGQGQSALQLTSNMTGVGSKPVIFTVTDDNTSAASGVVDALGLNNTTQYPANAVFRLNGESWTSSSNTFTVDKDYEVTLHSVSHDNESATISLHQDMNSLADSLRELVGSYNKLTSLISEGTSAGSRRIYGDFRAITEKYSAALNANGLSLQENGQISIDEDTLKQNSSDGSMPDKLSQINGFKNALYKKATAVMIDPMEYINKNIISYKNPVRPSADPYTTSIYTGMMFNGYC